MSVRFVCESRLVYRKKSGEPHLQSGKSGHVQATTVSLVDATFRCQLPLIRGNLHGQYRLPYYASGCESFFAQRDNIAANGASRMETDMEVQVVKYLVG